MKRDEKEFFFNPNDPKSAEVLSVLLSQTILFLAQVYSGNTSGSEITHLVGKNEYPSKLVETLRELLKREVSTRKFDTKFMGQIHPQGNIIAIIAKVVAGFMNNNSIVREVSPAETKMEYEVCSRIAKWFGYDEKSFAANITTGGTSANLNALWVAREKAKALGKKGPYYILTSEMRHYSVDKSADILGENVKTRLVPMHGFKIDYEKLESIVEEIESSGKGSVMAIIGIAGETETGEIDNINKLAEIARKYQTHLHIDAAYGGPFILSKARVHFSGIKHADSITIDPHKMIYTPYSAGIVLFKKRTDQMLIEASMKDNARYLLQTGEESKQTNEDRNLGMTRVEGSMGTEGALMTWATLELLGEKGLAEILNHTLELTQYAYKFTEQSKILRPIHKPMINTLLIGLRLKVSKEKYNELIEHMRNEADKSGYYISTNHDVDNGLHALRLVPMHPHSTTNDIRSLLEILEKSTEKF